MMRKLGVNVTFHAAPEVLRESHGDRSVSFQPFFQLRPNPGVMGRMWNNVMGL